MCWASVRACVSGWPNSPAMIDTRTPIGRCSGGGFGNTVVLDDGTLVTSYSYWRPDTRPPNPPIPATLFNYEVVRWRLP